MAETTSKIALKEPKSFFEKPLHFDVRELFRALSKGIGHTAVGKWEELATDAVDALSAIGLTTDPAELAFLLIRRAIARAMFELVGESASQRLSEAKKDSELLLKSLDLPASLGHIQIDKRFFDRPENLTLLKDIQSVLIQWLQSHGMADASARAIAARLPGYFVYALNTEWWRNSKAYRPLLEQLDTPFTGASEREWAWASYAALLQRRIEEGVFDEPFSLSQLYVPLNAYYLTDIPSGNRSEALGHAQQRRRVVVSLEEEINKWLQSPHPQDAIRVISGGPGSGKSCFARILAARLAHEGKARVLFVPLHLIDPTKDLVEEVGRFLRDEGILTQNPLDPDSPEASLLMIFDGLDELTSQGKAAAETARAFVREVERTVEKRNLQTLRLRVLISGRELVVQENESEFRRPRQILTLLPYFVPRTDREVSLVYHVLEQYEDPGGLLKRDHRQTWWKKYGELAGYSFDGLPKELARIDLDEITAQPLLNYLIALSFTRGKLDFGQRGINLNAIYSDLVAAVHERAYEKYRSYGPIRHMTLANFTRVLEEIGLAAWHGDGRTTTVREIEEHCRTSGVGGLLDAFEEGARAGVTRLLAAFFFRRYGQRASGDPTFVFTHKSFGEYLAARRVVRAMERMSRELEKRRMNLDEGWDQKDALKHWVEICGPSAISRYLHIFLLNEMKSRQKKDVTTWQERLAELFSFMLRNGMPMEQLHLASFRQTAFQSRNAEEALLALLNACARVTKQVSSIKHPDPTAFGAWFRRIQGQRTGPEPVLAAHCLSYLDLSGVVLHIIDFYNANLQGSNLQDVEALFSCMGSANLQGAILRGARLTSANLERSNLKSADLRGAYLQDVNLSHANLKEARLKGAHLENVNLRAAIFESNDIENPTLKAKPRRKQMPPPKPEEVETEERSPSKGT